MNTNIVDESNMLDTWEVAGTDRDELVRILQDMADRTYQIHCTTDNLCLLNRYSHEALQYTGDEEQMLFLRCDNRTALVRNGKVATENKSILTASRKKLAELGMTDELLNEMDRLGGLFQLVATVPAKAEAPASSDQENFLENEKTDEPQSVVIPDSWRPFLKDDIRMKPFLISENFIQCLAQRCRIGGRAISDYSPKRNEYIMEQCRPDRDLSLIVRLSNNRQFCKVFAQASAKYALIPQTYILDAVDAVDDMGTPEIVSWIVSNLMTYVEVTFPEAVEDYHTVTRKVNVTPGLIVRTSDTTGSSFQVICAVQMDNHQLVSLDEKVFTRHYGKVNSAKIMDRIDKDIFREVRHFTDRICELGMYTEKINLREALQLGFKAIDAAHNVLKPSVEEQVIDNIVNEEGESEVLPLRAMELAMYAYERPELHVTVAEALREISARALFAAYETLIRKHAAA